MRTLLVTCCLLLTACGTVYKWYRAGATPADYQRDTYACTQESGVYTAGGTPIMIVTSAIVGQRSAQRLFNACMTARGWEAQPND